MDTQAPMASRYTFHGHSGYLIDPRSTNAPHGLLALGHTASYPPWRDPYLHAHADSDEIYCLLQGELQFLIGEACLNLQAGELLLVRAGVPHAILGGLGTIEHFGLRVPAKEDKSLFGEIPTSLPEPINATRTFHSAWGARLSLAQPEHHNTWLVGGGSAQIYSPHLSLAYLDFPAQESANAGIGSRHKLHYHKHSWEYYLVLQGEKTLRVGADLVEFRAGEILEVPPNLPHTLVSRQAPFQGFTLRVPAVLDDKVEVE
ncbi:MAG TPA: cupin domain-containing protein [Anaerolineales bacterium]|nr:cupin domain-containing protein [Anaerolineales bacterium]